MRRIVARALVLGIVAMVGTAAIGTSFQRVGYGFGTCDWTYLGPGMDWVVLEKCREFRQDEQGTVFPMVLEATHYSVEPGPDAIEGITICFGAGAAAFAAVAFALSGRARA